MKEMFLNVFPYISVNVVGVHANTFPSKHRKLKIWKFTRGYAVNSFDHFYNLHKH